LPIHVHTLTTWHCPHSPAARRCCCNRSISPASRAHSSKPAAAAAGSLLWTSGGTDRRTDTVPFRRPCSAYCAGNARSANNHFIINCKFTGERFYYENKSRFDSWRHEFGSTSLPYFGERCRLKLKSQCCSAYVVSPTGRGTWEDILDTALKADASSIRARPGRMQCSRGVTPWRCGLMLRLLYQQGTRRQCR